MSAQLLSGKKPAQHVKDRVSAQVAVLQRRGITATLAVVVATEDGSSQWYVRSIASAAVKAGVTCRVLDLGAEASERDIATRLEQLGRDPDVHGVILQTPLPSGVCAARLLALIPPAKDIDGANPLSLGRLAAGEPAFAPATARSVIELLDHYKIPVTGRHVAVVGRSNVVGKPLLHLLLHRDATVTICHSRSRPLAAFTRPADVVVVAVGLAGLVTDEHVFSGAVVVDVGTNVTADGALVGDVDQASVSTVARALSPVPGGVGTLTTALLLLHTVEAAAATLPLRSGAGCVRAAWLGG